MTRRPPFKQRMLAALYRQNMSIERIAERLALPFDEAELAVIDLEHDMDEARRKRERKRAAAADAAFLGAFPRTRSASHSSGENP